jgi:hypothetical protein
MLIAPAREHKQGRGWEVNVPDTNNSSYGTVTDEVKHDRNCSSRTFYADLCRRFHKIFRQELPRKIPEEIAEAPTQSIFKILVQGPSLRTISTGYPQELLTRTCTRSCKDTERVSLGLLPARASNKDLYKITQTPLTAWRYRIATRSCHKEL